MKNNYEKLFAKLAENLKVFVDEIKNKRHREKATSEWSVKDILCHITFWHSNYAANYRALSLNKKPPLLDGPGYRLNKEGVSSLRKYSSTELIKKLNHAQKSLYQSIVIKGVPRMTYKKNGRVYDTSKFLLLIASHLHTHTVQVRRAG